MSQLLFVPLIVFSIYPVNCGKLELFFLTANTRVSNGRQADRLKWSCFVECTEVLGHFKYQFCCLCSHDKDHI